ncbi:MAG TPA: hypothetical protein VKB59_12810 [Micromonosporaceae bacterium]|nr:hypothetical protein [Micromonosporaceae bacterium]
MGSAALELRGWQIRWSNIVPISIATKVAVSVAATTATYPS